MNRVRSLTGTSL